MQKNYKKWVKKCGENLENRGNGEITKMYKKCKNKKCTKNLQNPQKCAAHRATGAFVFSNIFSLPVNSLQVKSALGQEANSDCQTKYFVSQILSKKDFFENCLAQKLRTQRWIYTSSEMGVWVAGGPFHELQMAHVSRVCHMQYNMTYF